MFEKSFESSAVGNGIELSAEKKDLLEKKLWAAREVARAELGSLNIYRCAEIFYQSLYNSGYFNDREIVDGEYRRKEILTTPMVDLKKIQIPSEKEFVRVVRRAMTGDIDYSKNLFPGALEALENLSKFGPITIWTKGDVYGSGNYPGSKEQLKKLATAGIGDLRKKLAKSSQKRPEEIIAVSASENKLGKIPEILKNYQKQNIRLVVVDDLLENLISAVNKSKEVFGIEMYPVQIVSDTNKKIGNNFCDTIESLSEIIDLLKNKNMLVDKDNGKIGFIVDFDDVIVDDEKRKLDQIRSVVKQLQSRGWV